MNKQLLSALVAFAVPSIALADNVGGCGWGSKLFDGKSGLFPQVLAVTTNGTLGNQTFGITSGTSGCSQDGVVKSNWRTAAFIDANMNKLAQDMSKGEGETLASLASLIGVSNGDSEAFNSAMKQNFAKIFSSPDVSSEQVVTGVKSTLEADNGLAKYSAGV